jgi:hypothetical protein
MGADQMGDSIDEGDPHQTNDLALMDETHFVAVLTEANGIIHGERRQRKTFRRVD